jgi:hypothetical protein
MIHRLPCQTADRPSRIAAHARRAAWTAVAFMASGAALAQQPGVHYWHQGALPPGAIGIRQLQRGGPLPGFFQPVEIRAPSGALVSLAAAGQFGPAHETSVEAGMLIGQVYRIRVGNIPLHEGEEVFPTIEVIDRLYAPPGQERRFPIPVDLTLEDLRLALDGKFVTRVIYVEDPRQALPAHVPPGQNWFEAAPGKDPLAVADALGRPVAILRLGARVPAEPAAPSEEFLYGSPPYVEYPPKPQPTPEAAPQEPQPQSEPAPGEPIVTPPGEPTEARVPIRFR